MVRLFLFYLEDDEPITEDEIATFDTHIQARFRHLQEEHEPTDTLSSGSAYDDAILARFERQMDRK